MIGEETLRQVEQIAESGAKHFRGIKSRSSLDNLLRTVQQHHVQLSVMADMKASILITVSSIVATISIARSGDPSLRAALLTLALACLIALVLGMVAVLPTFAKRPGPRNLLFFGHFGDMSEDEYMKAMEQIASSDDLLYEAAVRDIHSLGTFLHRKKYRFLRLAYMALIAGFISAALVELFVLLH
ncbi:MAG TPA: Pycsar system effector family protein [Thermoanaerobaculia bacterium]|nr:Pycsar system effector family protein [Thermoanaerobaculia bacterium]